MGESKWIALACVLAWFGCVDSPVVKRKLEAVPDAGDLLEGDAGPLKPPKAGSRSSPPERAPVLPPVVVELDAGVGERRDAGSARAPQADDARAGAAAGRSRSTIGRIVISEVMADPKALSDAQGEWFELHNPADESFALKGCAISDGSAQNHALDEAAVIPAGGFVTVARGEMPGFVPDVVSSLSLKNDSDAIEVFCDGVSLDRVAYDKASGFPIAAGAAMALDAHNLSAEDNDEASAWCLASATFGADRGTPGEANPRCAADDAGR